MSLGRLFWDVCLYIEWLQYYSITTTEIMYFPPADNPLVKQHHLWRPLWLTFVELFVLSFGRPP